LIELKLSLSKLIKMPIQETVEEPSSQPERDPAELLDQWFPTNNREMYRLRSAVQVAELPPEQTVFRRGDPCDNYLVVVSGRVRVQALSAGGREVVLYRVTDAQSCVITTSCLISQEVYPAEGITESETTALVLPRHLFNEALETSEPFRRFVFGNQGRRLAELIQRVEDMAFGRVDARLARLLVDRCHNTSGSVAATHLKLAGELGTAREVVSRQLKAFEKNGWIAVRRGSVEVLQPEALWQVWKEAE
jgi:CRP/FNR family transcriptional regulator